MNSLFPSKESISPIHRTLNLPFLGLFLSLVIGSMCNTGWGAWAAEDDDERPSRFIAKSAADEKKREHRNQRAQAEERRGKGKVKATKEKQSEAGDATRQQEELERLRRELEKVKTERDAALSQLQAHSDSESDEIEEDEDDDEYVESEEETPAVSKSKDKGSEKESLLLQALAAQEKKEWKKAYSYFNGLVGIASRAADIKEAINFYKARLSLINFFLEHSPKAFMTWQKDKESTLETAGRYAGAAVRGALAREWDPGEPIDHQMNTSILDQWIDVYNAILGGTMHFPLSEKISLALESEYGEILDAAIEDVLLELPPTAQREGKSEFKGLETLYPHFEFKPVYEKSMLGTKAKSKTTLDIYLQPLIDHLDVAQRVLAMISCLTNSHLETRHIKGVMFFLPMQDLEELFTTFNTVNLFMRGLANIRDRDTGIGIVFSNARRNAPQTRQFISMLVTHSLKVNGDSKKHPQTGAPILLAKLPFQGYEKATTEKLIKLMEKEGKPASCPEDEYVDCRQS